MNARKPLIYLAVFLILGLAYYFYEYKGGETRQVAQELADKALVFPADSVTAFSVSRRDSLGADSLALERTAAGWQLVYPLAAPADSEAVSRLLHSAAEAKLDRVVEDSAGDLSVFGLDRPVLTLSLLPAGGDSTLRLFLGHKNPTGSFIYAASSSQPRRVILLNSWVEGDIQKGPSDLRDKKALHFTTSAVERLTLTRGDRKALELVRPESGGWRIEQPLQAPAEADSVAELLKAIETAEALRFVDSLAPEGLAAYGLDKPAFMLSLAEDKGESVRQLFFGGKADSASWYARRQGMDKVYVLPASLVDRLCADPGRLRDLALVHANRERIDSLVLVRPAGELVLGKDTSGVWSIRTPHTAKADGPRVDGLLWDIKDLRARRFLDPVPPAVERALAAPALSVVVGVSHGTTRLAIARLSPADSTLYVRVEGSPGVAEIDSAALGKIDLQFEDLRDRRIMSFDTGSIDRVRLEYPDRTIELAKKDAEWTLTEPEKAPVKDWKVQNLLWDLEGLNFKSEFSAGDADSLGRGFGKPSLRVGLWKGDSLKAQVAFGDSLPGKAEVWLRARGDQRTFSVDRKVLAGLPSKVEDLKKEDTKANGK